MLTMKYLMKSLKARGIFTEGKASSDGGEWNPRPKSTPKPEKPDFIKENEFKV